LCSGRFFRARRLQCSQRVRRSIMPKTTAQCAARRAKRFWRSSGVSGLRVEPSPARRRSVWSSAARQDVFNAEAAENAEKDTDLGNNKDTDLRNSNDTDLARNSRREARRQRTSAKRAVIVRTQSATSVVIVRRPSAPDIGRAARVRRRACAALVVRRPKSAKHASQARDRKRLASEAANTSVSSAAMTGVSSAAIASARHASQARDSKRLASEAANRAGSGVRTGCRSTFTIRPPYGWRFLAGPKKNAPSTLGRTLQAVSAAA
jgi:hypothetical protein